MRSLLLALIFCSLPLTAHAQLLNFLDRTAPTVEIVAPTHGAAVTGTVDVVASASDGFGSGIAAVEFQIDRTDGAWTALSFDLMGGRWSGAWDTAAVPNGSRAVYVRARDRAGNVRIAFATVMVGNPPAAPTGLRVAAPAGASDGGALDLQWSPNREADVVGYHVYKSNAFSGPYARVATVAGTTWRDPAVPNESTQHYQISAYDSFGNESPRSATASGTAFDTKGPEIAGIAVQHIDADTVRITWQTHEPATSEVEYGTSPALGEAVRTFAFVTEHAVELDGLAVDTTWYFVVRGRDAAANSGQSAMGTFTTRPNDPPTVEILSPADGSLITGPARLVAAASDDVSVAHVEWTVGGTEWQPLPLNVFTGYYEVDLAGAPDGSAPIGVRAWDDQGASAMDAIQVTLDRHAPVVELLSPGEDAHMEGGVAHPIRVRAEDATIASVEWQLIFVPAGADIEVAPTPDPAAWEALPFDTLNNWYETSWTAPVTVIEKVGFVYVRVMDGAGRVVAFDREITVIPTGVDFAFVGTGGQSVAGGVAIAPIDGVETLGLEFRCRECTPGGAYTVTVVGDGGTHSATLRADARGRGEAFLEEPTAIGDVNTVTITPAGPGF